MSDEHITFDRAMLRRLQRAYAKAVEDNVEQFTFEGNEYVIGYAKYLIEYLAARLTA